MTIKRTCLTLAAALAFLGGCQSVEGESESPARPEPARQVSAAEAALAAKGLAPAVSVIPQSGIGAQRGPPPFLRLPSALPRLNNVLRV